MVDIKANRIESKAIIHEAFGDIVKANNLTLTTPVILSEDPCFWVEVDESPDSGQRN